MDTKSFTNSAQALCEPTRLAIMQALTQADVPVHVSIIASGLCIPQGSCSHHLKILAEANLIERSTSGKYVMYKTSNTGLWNFAQEVLALRCREPQVVELPKGAA